MSTVSSITVQVDNITDDTSILRIEAQSSRALNGVAPMNALGEETEVKLGVMTHRLTITADRNGDDRLDWYGWWESGKKLQIVERPDVGPAVNWVDVVIENVSSTGAPGEGQHTITARARRRRATR
jgi:hypothetical protein